METGKLRNKVLDNIEIDYTVLLYYCRDCAPEKVTCAGCAIMKIMKAMFLDIFQETAS